EEVPAVVKDMSPYRRWLEAPLRRTLAEAERVHDGRKQLHLALALLPADETHVEYLVDRLLTGSPTEVVAIRTSFARHAHRICRRLWTTLEDAAADRRQRLCAACFLAAYAPDDIRWQSLGRDVVACLVMENAFSLKEWSRALRPVEKALLPTLANFIV